MMTKTTSFETILVPHQNGQYPIYMGEALLNNSELLRRHIVAKQILVVTNETIAPLYLQYLQQAFQGYQFDDLILPDGESYKNIEQITKIIDVLAKKQHHRDTTLIALGGGVIGDMTGFAAACYQRGVAFMQIPTSLLAQVDASIGGKTGVNHPLGKNLIGAFHQPQAVFIDIATHNTLPDREFCAGLAEIIKAALIKDADFFSWLENHIDALLNRDKNSLITAIKNACTIKRDVVAIDEREAGERALLNFGHTFGHAIEQILQYQNLLHGEAVAIGMVIAAQLSKELGYLNAHDCQRITQLLIKARLPTELPKNITADLLLSAMQQDKKILNQQLRLILLKKIGQGFIEQRIDSAFLKGWLLQFMERSMD